MNFKPFIDTIELAELCGISQRQATEIIKAVQTELREKGAYVIKSRPLMAPRKEVYRKLGLEE